MRYFKDLLGVITKDSREIINLTRSIKFDIDKNSDYVITYYIKDGDTPESIAENLYGDTDFWWIIMLTSGNKNRFNDWPMTDIELSDYINLLILDGEMVGTDEEIEALKTENDDKRTITLLDPKYLEEFMYKVEKIWLI